MNSKFEVEAFVDAIEAGTFLRLRPRRVLELARRGSLPGHPIGDGKRKVWRFRLSELSSAVVGGPYRLTDSSPLVPNTWRK